MNETHERSPQNLYLFGRRKVTWQSLAPENWDTLNLPVLWQNQIFDIRIAVQGKLALLEFRVSEQMPKESYSHIAKGLAKLNFEIVTLSFIHDRSAGVHLAFMRCSQHSTCHHLDLNFAQMSRFDEKVVKVLQEGSLRDFERLLELMAGSALNKNFYNALRTQLREIPVKSKSEYYALVDLTLKIIFLIFVQRKGWLNCDPRYLQTHMEACDRKALSIVTAFFTPLFARLEGIEIQEKVELGQLPKLGGGLFAFNRMDLPAVPNTWCLDLYRMLVSQFSFSLFEANEGRNIIGISPEVLGHVFENLLQSDDRKRQGTFYTPMHVAQRQARAAFKSWVFHNKNQTENFEKRLEEIRILDPSCGSGTYLVAAFNELLKLRLQAAPERQRYNGKLFELKREIVLKNLFGVDIHPMAVRLAEVRLWLNMIQDLEVSEPILAPPLPNLQHHLRAGDFLKANWPNGKERMRKWPKYRYLERARKRFPHVAAKIRNESLRHIFRLEEELITWMNTSNHRIAVGESRVRVPQPSLPGFPEPEPLCFPEMEKTDHRLHIAFSDVFLKGGFHIILGNPPWQKAAAMTPRVKENIRQNLQLPAQMTLSGQVDLSLYFFVACLGMLKRRGHLGMLLPNKLLQAQYAATIRSWIGQFSTLNYLFDYGVDNKLIFQADTFPLALGISMLKAPRKHLVDVEIHVKDKIEHFRLQQRDLAIAGRPWLLLEMDEERMLKWPMLSHFSYKVMRGIVTSDKANFTFSEKPAQIPESRLRPLLRGRDMGPQRCQPLAWVYWPFDLGSHWWHKIPESEQSWLKRTGRLKPYENGFRVPYHPRRIGPWVLVWKYLSVHWEVVLVRCSGDWVPDQTVYYINFDSFEMAWRFFAWFHSKNAQKQIKALAERGKSQCRFFYAHSVEQIKVPKDIQTRPMAIPQITDLITPIHGKGVWKE